MDGRPEIIMPLLSIVGGKGLTSWVARRSFVAMQWASRRQPSGFRAINEQRWIDSSRSGTR